MNFFLILSLLFMIHFSSPPILQLFIPSLLLALSLWLCTPLTELTWILLPWRPSGPSELRNSTGMEEEGGSGLLLAVWLISVIFNCPSGRNTQPSTYSSRTRAHLMSCSTLSGLLNIFNSLYKTTNFLHFVVTMWKGLIVVLALIPWAHLLL